MKKISADAYAEAFLQALKGAKDQNKIVERFIVLIRENNDWARRRQILEACERKWRQANGMKVVTIESARALTGEQRAQLEKRWKDPKRDVQYRINSTLIAGVKILLDEERQFDGSLKKKLDSVFQ